MNYPSKYTLKKTVWRDLGWLLWTGWLKLGTTPCFSQYESCVSAVLGVVCLQEGRMHMKQFMCVKQCMLCSDMEQVGAVMPLEIQLETAPNSSCYQQSQAVKR